MAITIKIEKGNLNGTLKLSDRGHTKAKKGRTIKWKIKDTSNVTSILNIQLKDNTTDIFSRLPYKDDEDGRKWKAEIDEDADDYAECEYSITWLGDDGKTNTHDPKITVMPSGFAPLKLLIALVTIFLGFFSWQLLRRKINRK